MKKITLGLITLLAGELLVISKKDRTFRRVLKKKKGLDKVSYIFQTLVNFNKSIVDDTSKEIDKMDIPGSVKQGVEDTKDQLHMLYKKLQEQVSLLEDKVLDLSDAGKDEALQQLDRVKKVYVKTKKKVQEAANDMVEKNDLEEKLVAIKKNIDTIRKSIK